MTFTTQPVITPLGVTTAAANTITQTGTKLNGNLTSLSSDVMVSVSFEYGTSTNYGSSTTTQSRTAIGVFNATLSGLTPGTTYHFRSKAVGSTTVYGNDAVFTTSPSATTPSTQDGGTIIIVGGGEPQILDISGVINSGGVFQEDFVIDLKYGTDWIGIIIKKGTRALDADGRPLTSIGVTAPVSLASPPSSISPVLVFELSPSGATFSMPLTFTYQFDTRQLPSGANASDLYMAFYQAGQNTWQMVDYTLDAANNRIMGNLSHFSMYAVLVNSSVGLLSGGSGFGWNIAATIIICELLVGGVVVYLFSRRRQPVPAIARAQYRYQSQAAAVPRSMRAMGRPPAQTEDRETETIIWDDLLKGKQVSKTAFKTHLEIIGGKLVVPADKNTTDFEIISTPEQRTVISLEFDPETNPRGTAKIKVLGTVTEYEKSKELKHE